MEWIARERQVDDGDRSDEDFDRIAFAAHALERLQIRQLRIALCPLRPATRTRATAEIALATGRDWKTPEGRWATLFIPADASRRAIVAALAALTVDPISPYLLNALISARVAS